MKNLDFIKKCCDKTEHYQVVEHPLHAIWFLRFNNGHNSCLPDLQIGHIPEGSPIYRDLLQSAIEGVNREWRKSKKSFGTVKQFSEDIVLHQMIGESQIVSFPFSVVKNIVQAKEFALEYIFAQENK